MLSLSLLPFLLMRTARDSKSRGEEKTSRETKRNFLAIGAVASVERRPRGERGKKIGA